MKIAHKEFIVKEIEFLISKTSANKVAVKAKVSSANISQMINNNWELISDNLWNKVKVNLQVDWAWQIANTENLKRITDWCAKAQRGKMSLCISANAGWGKTTGFRHYQRLNSDVIVISCKNYWTKKSFARHHLLACGLQDRGTTEEMIEMFQAHLTGLGDALVIYDQFDKLKETQKDLFMDYYNDLDGHTGFILSGVSHLKKQEKKGCKAEKMGYEERFSRYGSKFLPLQKFTKKEVTAICTANGVTDKEAIENVYDEVAFVNGDGRRLKRMVERYFLTEADSIV